MCRVWILTSSSFCRFSFSSHRVCLTSCWCFMDILMATLFFLMVTIFSTPHASLHGLSGLPQCWCLALGCRDWKCNMNTFNYVIEPHCVFPFVFSRFIKEIEHAMELGPAKQCPLREFLTMYIKNIFLNQVLAEINKEIEGVTKASDPLKILANADTMKILGVQRPLLQVGTEI